MVGYTQEVYDIRDREGCTTEEAHLHVTFGKALPPRKNATPSNALSMTGSSIKDLIKSSKEAIVLAISDDLNRHSDAKMGEPYYLDSKDLAMYASTLVGIEKSLDPNEGELTLRERLEQQYGNRDLIVYDLDSNGDDC